MRRRNLSRTAIALAVTLCAGPAVMSSAAQAQGLCYSGGQVAGGNKSGVLKSNAKKRARASWRTVATRVMGTSRAGNWGRALNRRYYCHHSFVWHCTAWARPCA